jgi:parallel beta-helix repeat protein
MIVALIICCQTASATFYVCTNCSDCTNKINSAVTGSIVYLTMNIASNGTCINIQNKSGVTFDCQEFVIMGSGRTSNDYAGINLINASDNTIKNCVIRRFDYALFADSSNDTAYQDNTLEDSCTGINSEYSDRNNFTGNIIKDCECRGADLYHCEDNRFTGNQIRNSSNALSVVRSDNNVVSSNVIDNNDVIGIHLLISSNNIISGNRISNTTDNDAGYTTNGIEIGVLCEGNQIINNTIEQNEAAYYSTNPQATR